MVCGAKKPPTLTKRERSLVVKPISRNHLTSGQTGGGAVASSTRVRHAACSFSMGFDSMQHRPHAQGRTGSASVRPSRPLPGRRGTDVDLARARYACTRHGKLHVHRAWHEECCMHESMRHGNCRGAQRIALLSTAGIGGARKARR